MIVVEASGVVPAPAGEVLEFVMDVDRYRRADHKIRKVYRVERDGNEAVVRMLTVARGVPVMATQRMRLTPGERIDVTNEPSWQDRLVDFHGEFVCQPDGDGVQVTHRYKFEFKGIGRIVEPVLRGWLQRDIAAEVGRIVDEFRTGLRTG